MYFDLALYFPTSNCSQTSPNMSHSQLHIVIFFFSLLQVQLNMDVGLFTRAWATYLWPLTEEKGFSLPQELSAPNSCFGGGGLISFALAAAGILTGLILSVQINTVVMYPGRRGPCHIQKIAPHHTLPIIWIYTCPQLL